MKPNKLTRRKFFNNVIGAGMALSLGNFTLTDSFGNTIPTLSQNNKMEKLRKTMVFSKQLEWIKDYNELCELVAEIGFDGLELTVRPGGYVLPERVEVDLPKVAEAAQKAGIEILMISTNIKNSRDVLTEKILKTANQLGIKFYRMGGLSYNESQSIEQYLIEYKSIFQDLAEMNKHYQIHGAYQNHAGGNRVSASIWDLWFILKDLDPNWIGCQYDTRHSQLEGGSWWPIGLKLINSYVKTTVVKDFKWVTEGNQKKAQNCPIGEGEVDFQTYFELVKKYDIKGPISLHFPYPFIKDIDNLSKTQRFEMTKKVMKQKGVIKLKAMLEVAGLG